MAKKQETPYGPPALLNFYAGFVGIARYKCMFPVFPIITAEDLSPV